MIHANNQWVHIFSPFLISADILKSALTDQTMQTKAIKELYAVALQLEVMTILLIYVMLTIYLLLWFKRKTWSSMILVNSSGHVL